MNPDDKLLLSHFDGKQACYIVRHDPMLLWMAYRYLNNTGLMWESAAEFGALLVFAEHRYYGESKPYSGSELRKNMQYLTAEQAMADYAELLADLKADLQAQQSAVIGFGGSYGGMLASWMRMKYPHVLDGAIAGSAPIWAFPGEDPPVDSGAFAKIVTRDATPAGGSAKACAGQKLPACQDCETICSIYYAS